LNARCYGILVSHVEGYRIDLGAFLSQGTDGSLEPCFIASINDDFGARSHETAGDREANAAARAGNERATAREIELLQ
jgi:hypothetical protein